VLEHRQPDDPLLPAGLRRALREWRALADAVARSGGPEEHEMVRRRGRLLASRVADVLGRPVEFIDPTTGVSETIPDRDSDPGRSDPNRPAAERTGSTPWATGLAISTFAAVFVAIGDVVLSRAFAEAFGLLWVPANLLVGLGLAPSLYLLRGVPFWRWPAMGVTAGLVVAWVVLLFGLLA
jgi:Protein of unknown function (DUF2537)